MRRLSLGNQLIKSLIMKINFVNFKPDILVHLHLQCVSLITFIHVEIQFDCKAIGKHVNADLSIDLGEMSVKFHIRPLDEVVAEEIKLGLVEAVPEDYFT
jgi:uncharacterized protein